MRALKERGHSAPVVERLEIALANLRRQPQTLVPAVDSLARIRMIAPERADRLRDEAWLATLAEKAADPEAQREYWRGLPKASGDGHRTPQYTIRGSIRFRRMNCQKN